MLFSNYSIIFFAALLGSLVFWIISNRSNESYLLVYCAGFVGAVFGAKLVYLTSEFWKIPWDAPYSEIFQYILTGKSVLGALLFGYLGVEIGKSLSHHKEVTGDLFALIVPLAIAVGRIGCLLHGCCLGADPRMSAALLDGVFQISIWCVLYIFYRRGLQQHQLFHIYLISYGVFRFIHEPLRGTPKVDTLFFPFSIYQLWAIALILFGAERYYRRRGTN